MAGPDRRSTPGDGNERPPRVPGYEVTGWIGQGAYGRVWLATQSATGRPVAIKVLDRSGPRNQARFAREARILGRLAGHPHIVEVIGFGRVRRGGMWLAMERLPSSLAVELETGQPMPPERVADIGVQLAGALAATHAQGLLHRDVKPHNVLVGVDGRVKLADFGIAQATRAGGSATGRDSVLGALDYLAPELRSDTGQATPASDQYALGATLIALLAGTSSIGDDEGKSNLLDSCSAAAELVAVVRRAISADPTARYPSLADLAADLGRVQDRSGWPVTPYRAAVGPPPPDRHPDADGGASPGQRTRLPWEAKGWPALSRPTTLVATVAVIPVLVAVVFAVRAWTSAGAPAPPAGSEATGTSLNPRWQVIAVEPPMDATLDDVSGLDGEDCMFQAPVLGPVTLTLRSALEVRSIRLSVIAAVPAGETIEVQLGDGRPQTLVLEERPNYEPQSVDVEPTVTDTITFLSDRLGICHVIVG